MRMSRTFAAGNSLARRGARWGAALALLASTGCAAEAPREEQISSASQAIETFEGSTADKDCDWTEYHGHKVWGCSLKLPFGPTGGEAPIDPDAWGICGFGKIQGTTDALSTLRIVVDEGGYYQAFVAVGDPSAAELKYRVHCARMTDFDGVPDPAKAKETRSYSVSSHDAPDPGEIAVYRALADHGGELQDVCLWTGFDGDLDMAPNKEDVRLFAGTRLEFNHGWSLDAATFGQLSHNFTSYARCDGYSPAYDWDGLVENDWIRFLPHYAYSTSADKASWLPLLGEQSFCWISGISPYGEGKGLSADVFISSPPPPQSPADTWAYETDGHTSMGIQCMPYKQWANW